MSKSVMLSMLAECDNGSELISILDYLSSDNVDEDADSLEALNSTAF